VKQTVGCYNGAQRSYHEQDGNLNEEGSSGLAGQHDVEQPCECD